MSEAELRDKIDGLAARVTALTLLVEALYVDDLAKDDNAAIIGEAVVRSALSSEEKAIAASGNTEYAMRITAELTSIIDRAVGRAIAQRARRSSK